MLQNLYMYFRFYTCLTEHILVLRILFLCEGTRRYDKSERIIIISPTKSYQTYVDTYHIWTLVHSRYGSQQIHILILPIREYPWVLQNLYLFYLYESTHRYYWTYTDLTDTGVPVGTTELISYTCFTDMGVPVGTTGLILILLIREYP